MRNKTFTIGLIACAIIIVALFAVLFLKGYKKKVDDDMANKQSVESGSSDKLVEYKAVLMVSDPSNETLVNNTCKVLKERIDNFEISGEVNVVDDTIEVVVNAKESQVASLKFIGAKGDLEVKTTDGKTIIDPNEIESITVREFAVSDGTVKGLDIIVNEDYKETLKKNTEYALNKDIMVCLDGQMLLGFEWPNVIESGECVITGLSEDVMEAISVMYMGEKMPEKLTAKK